MLTSSEVTSVSLPVVPADLVNLFVDGKDFRLVTHVKGDPDSATVFALAAALRKLGKRVECWHDVPEHLAWLIPQHVSDSLSEQPLVIAIDTGNYSRLALSSDERQGIKHLLSQAEREDQIANEAWSQVCAIDAVIDHHVSNHGYGRLNWIQPQASSSAELLTALLLALEAKSGVSLLDADMAWRLFTGLASDTQWFQRPVSPSAYVAASTLESRWEIDKARIAEELRAQSEGYFRLGGALRNTMHILHGVASAFIRREEMDKYGVAPEEAAALIEDLERLPVRISLLFIESKPGEFRVRLRGKDIPIIHLAKQFGGGGHTYRAGASVPNQESADALIKAAVAIVEDAQ